MKPVILGFEITCKLLKKILSAVTKDNTKIVPQFVSKSRSWAKIDERIEASPIISVLRNYRLKTRF